MSDVINTFIAELEDDTDLDSVLRTNIYPLLAPDNQIPAIVYQYTDGIRESFYSGSFGLKTTTIALNMYHTDYDVLVAARERLETRWHGFSGTLGTLTISEIEMGDAFFTAEQANGRTYRCTVEFDIIT